MFRRQPALSSVCTLSSEPAWPEAELGINKACANPREPRECPVPAWLPSLAAAERCPTGTGCARSQRVHRPCLAGAAASRAALAAGGERLPGLLGRARVRVGARAAARCPESQQNTLSCAFAADPNASLRRKRPKGRESVLAAEEGKVQVADED